MSAQLFFRFRSTDLDAAVPSKEEINLIIELLDTVASPLLDKVEHLLESAGHWDNVARNDFCRYVISPSGCAIISRLIVLSRYLHHVRSMWSGLSTLFLEGQKEIAHPHLYEDLELEELLVRPLGLRAGFALEDPSDPRYQKAVAYRTRFGSVIHRAAITLQQKQDGEDHIDAVIAVSKAIDVYLLEYAMTRTAFEALQKTYTVTRE